MNQVTYNEREAVYKEVIRRCGISSQLRMAVEEMSELTKEICKIGRGMADMEALADEIADVTIMLEQLRLLYNLDDEVCEHMDMKVRRLRTRLGMDGEG